MLTNDVFYSRNERHIQCNCDICNEPVSFFVPDECRFIKINKDSPRCKIMYLDDGVMIFCSNECMKSWIMVKTSKLEDLCSEPIDADTMILNNIEHDDDLEHDPDEVI